MSELIITNRDDLIWLAGLLEGEGCFDLHRGKYPRIRLAMTDRDVVGRAATLMGCSLRLSLRKSPQKSTWHAETSGARAADILWQLLPHMGARRSQKIADSLGEYRLGDRMGMPGPSLSQPPGY